MEEKNPMGMAWQETRAAGVRWLERLVEATGWAPASDGSFQLGALVFEIEALIIDETLAAPLELWTISTMAVAPLERFAEALGSADPVFFGDRVFGARLDKCAMIDFSALESRHAKWESEALRRGLPSEAVYPLGLRPSLMAAQMCRNRANYMAANPGELIGLDALPGSSAMLLGKLSARVCEQSCFGAVMGAAMSGLSQALGGSVYYHRSAGAARKVPGWEPPWDLEKAWPKSIGEWQTQHKAWSDALDIEEAIGNAGAGSARKPTL